MKDSVPIAGIIAVFALILSVNGSTIKDNCNSLSYRLIRRRVEESSRPELIIVEKKYIADSTSGDLLLCHLDKSDNASSVPYEGFFQLRNNLAYDEHARALYVTFGEDGLRTIPVPRTSSKSKVHKRFARDITSQPEKEDVDIDALLDDVELETRSQGEIRSVAYDWNTKNVFFTTAQAIFVAPNTARDLLGEKKFIGTAIPADKRDDYNLIVHPNHGYIFLHPNVQELIRLNQDKKDRRHVLNYKTKTNLKIEAVTLDYDKDKIYWLERDETKNESFVHYSDLDGSNVKTLNLKNSTSHFAPTIAVDENYVYFARVNDKYNRNFVISRMGKTDGVFDSQFRITHANTKEVSFGLEQIMVLNPQKVLKSHPCLKNKGDCFNFCLTSPGQNGQLGKVCE